MQLVKLAATLVGIVSFSQTCASPLNQNTKLNIRQESHGLQDIVTWDSNSIYIRGERVLFYSGEFHPFRLPVPDLWLDVFQKIKALGYNGVSFYVNWALIEGEQGHFRADGIFALEPFFEAASQAGIYLLSRPGPYINAEASGGGFPGWLARVNATYRTNDIGFLEATDLYMNEIGTIIAKAQITNGGPVILHQPENEYSYPSGNITFPNYDYFGYVINQTHNAGIVVPLINNDAGPQGLMSPDNTTALVHVDVYGHDSYPLGFTCSQPYNWTDNRLPTNFRALHLHQSPSTPYAIVEFQGGSFDPWGGYGFDKCAALTNEQFERIFYKNNWSFGVKIFNIYMTYGGTNWGNLGHPLGYTSYDYGSPISEDRTINRAKYSDAKLLANFLKVTTSYLTAIPLNYTNGSYASTAEIAVTPLLGNGSATDLYIVRHAAYNSNVSTSYQLTVSSSIGNITIPQSRNLSDHLTLHGRDSKVHVVDYDLEGINLLYSSAEIFTWQKYDAGIVLVLYGGENETHEFALPSSQCSVSSGDVTGVSITVSGEYDVVQWNVTPTSKVVQCGKTTIHLLWRNEAYNWWVLELPAAHPLANYSSLSKTSIIVSGGYLLRTAQMDGESLYLTGDLNETTTINVTGAPLFSSVYFNGEKLDGLPATIEYAVPDLNLPDLSSIPWYSLDSLPELSSTYRDDLWTSADKTQTFNQFQPTTPEVLYASDYGYHSGSILYRGHFSTPGSTTALNLSLSTQGGYAYGYSVFLNSTSVYQFPGISTSQSHNATIQLSQLTPSTSYVLTLVIDHMGLTENFNPGNNTMREPRGLLSYNLTTMSSQPISITWKLTGNLGGESYIDKTRGPLNEGGMYYERQGLHLPGATLSDSTAFTATSSPLTGFSGPGLKFYATNFTLNLPTPQYDIPLAFVFTNASTTDDRATRIRAQLYVNGFQFGKYINHIGPQLLYPVPEGVLNYQGENYVGVSLWSLEEDSETKVKLGGFGLSTSNVPIISGRGIKPALSYSLPQDGWQRRSDAY